MRTILPNFTQPKPYERSVKKNSLIPGHPNDVQKNGSPKYQSSNDARHEQDLYTHVSYMCRDAACALCVLISPQIYFLNSYIINERRATRHIQCPQYS